MTPLLAGFAAAAGAWLMAARPTRLPAPPASSAQLPAVVAGTSAGHRLRVAGPLLAGLGCVLLVSGWPGLVLGVLAAWLVRHLATASEPVAVRKEREAVRRELPLVVLLLGSALRQGSASGPAVRQVCTALPGPASARLSHACDRLAMGVDPDQVWGGLAEDPELAPLGRTLARAHRSGAPVAAAVERLADDLAETARAEVADRARTVGVRAAVPLGVCLLPSFLLLGIVPLVATLLAGIRL